MEISFQTAKSGDKKALDSLFNSLNDSQYIRENARIKLPESARNDMGVDVATIDLVLTSGFKLAELAWQIIKWIMERDTPNVPIVVRTAGGTTTLDPSTISDPRDSDYVVRRALVGSSDPRNARCILVGVSDYGRLTALPGVQKNLQELRTVLLDHEIWGIPESKVQTIDYPRSAKTVIDAVRAAVASGPETLLFYFAGHGLYDENDELLLALPDATGDGHANTVQWKDIASILDDAPSRTIVWLDCCYAGLALPDTEGRPDTKNPPDLLEAARTKGAYILAATQGNGTAKSSDDDGCTVFTAELVNVLRTGIEPGAPTEEFISLNWLHQKVSSALSEKALPKPNWYDPGHIGRLPQFHNTMTRSQDDRLANNPQLDSAKPDAPRPDDDEPPLKKYRRLFVAGGSAALVLVAVIAYSLIPGPVVSGLDLSRYCSALATGGAQRLVVADDYCVQPIDLDSACVYTYQLPTLRARFESADPRSAVCENPASPSTYYGGISNMTGYCADHTKVLDVTATTENRRYPSTWTCQVDINKDLACDQQNNRVDLAAREQDDGNWVCHKKHML